MADLTAAEVQALAALEGHNPMTSAELFRAVADAGMHLGQGSGAVLPSLVAMGMAERTPAAHLGKYRITARGRAWIAARTG